MPAPSVATAKTVEKTADFSAAFERAVSAGKPAIIHMKTDPEALTSRITLSKAARAVAGAAALALASGGLYRYRGHHTVEFEPTGLRPR